MDSMQQMQQHSMRAAQCPLQHMHQLEWCRKEGKALAPQVLVMPFPHTQVGFGL
jgi:hypothetical protein